MRERPNSVKVALLAIDHTFSNCAAVMIAYMEMLEGQDDKIRALVMPLRMCGVWGHCPECQICPHEWSCRFIDGENLEDVLADYQTRMAEEIADGENS